MCGPRGHPNRPGTVTVAGKPSLDVPPPMAVAATVVPASTLLGVSLPHGLKFVVLVGRRDADAHLRRTHRLRPAVGRVPRLFTRA